MDNRSIPETDKTLVAALYKFVALPDYEELRPPLLAECEAAGILGTILLAAEGINGTFAGPRDGMVRVLNYLWSDPRFADLAPKFSVTERSTFYRMKVRLKKEIVTMGQPDVTPHRHVGVYVKPDAWNKLIGDPDTLLIDTRNGYESNIGTFEGAIVSKTKSFRDFPTWVEENLLSKPSAEWPKKIAMFCTGGIRCEKASAYMLDMGFDNVHHLEGGILKYLEQVPEAESKWQGECFVFDQRVSVGQGLADGTHNICHACRMPISPEDMKQERYVPGISCPQCHEKISDADRERFRARQHQIELAKQRQTLHLGQKFSKPQATGEFDG